MRDNAIEIKGVSKFVDGKPIVYRVNLEVPKGTLYGLLGPNGAGKSTTIKLLTGRIRPSSGKIRINGIDPWKDRVTVNSMIGYLPQNSIQYQEKTVIDFMVLMGKLIGKKNLFPSISPKKTWEGMLGGGVLCFLSSFLLVQFHPGYPKWTFPLLSIIIVGTSTTGDLIQSKFKRLALKKDSGILIPGHGGFYDRMDSVLFSAPFVFLFLMLLNYVS